MKLWALGFGALGLGLLGWPRPRPETITLFVSGNSQGYLSPCGCSEPMSGGIVRRGAVVRSASGSTLSVDDGGLITGTGRQDRMKAQTVIAALVSTHVSAINLTSDLVALGKGDLLALTSLAPQAFVSAQIVGTNDLAVKPFVERTGYAISGVSERAEQWALSLGVRALPIEQAVGNFCQAAGDKGETPILLLEGDHDQAQRLARQFPSLAVIVYTSSEDPPTELAREGNTTLVTPGFRGRFLVRVSLDHGQVRDYGRLELDPSRPSDPQVGAIYQGYLSRIDRSNLLEQMPRLDGSAFIGSNACAKCHAADYAVWLHSDHAHALRTLINQGHGRDPDCVVCHVVGIASTAGFRSVKATPQFANVGCESCHGAGKEHAAHPLQAILPKLGASACKGCHSADNSPRFDFPSYWKKIAHGVAK